MILMGHHKGVSCLQEIKRNQNRILALKVRTETALDLYTALITYDDITKEDDDDDEVLTILSETEWYSLDFCLYGCILSKIHDKSCCRGSCRILTCNFKELLTTI